MERVKELLTDEIEIPSLPINLSTIDKITITNLTAFYDNNQILKQFYATFEKGIPSIVYGSSGKGKSTLLRTMLGLMPNTSGQITISTGSLEYQISNALRNNFSFVAQGDKMFNSTVRENLSIGSQCLSQQQIDEVITMTCCEFIYDLPEGLETMLGESGFGLSEGQIQRIAIARALLRPAHVWLFDEVTSALDRETAHQLVRNLLDKGKNKIIVFVTHDRSLSEYFQKELDLDKYAETK